MRDFIKRALKKTDKMTVMQLKEFLAAFEEEYEILAGALDSLSVGIVICDVPGTVILYNKAAIPCFAGYFSDGATDKPVWECIRNEEIAGFIRKTITNEENAFDRVFHLSSGNVPLYLSFSVMPLVLEKRIRGSIIIVKNVTDAKEAEIQNRRLENLASLTNLAASVAHEIKNPLASISIYVQLLQKKIRSYGKEIAEDESIQKSLTVISSEIERLNKTIVNFLMAVRPIKLTAEPLSINAVIRNVADFVCEELRGKKIRLVLELDDTVPAISGDEERLRQVFLNFIKNAQEAIGNGREGTIAIRTKAKDTAVIVQIQDDGPGIAQEDLARIFEPYYTTKADGTGLGLPVAYKIIKEHGGDIQVCSFQGEGSCFSLIFPVIREAKRMIGYDSAPAAENKKQDSGGQP